MLCLPDEPNNIPIGTANSTRDIGLATASDGIIA
jgi:hypothetical protein